MNPSAHNSISEIGRDSASASVEATLRLVASLAAPDGLEDRVFARLKTTPRSARIHHWPAMLQPTSSWIRGAAAAAIVFVVAGGGWGVYSLVQPGQPAKVIVMPRAGTGGGFSSAGAMRTPQTVNGPLVAVPTASPEGEAQTTTVPPGSVKPLKKALPNVMPIRNAPRKAGAEKKALVLPAVSAAR